jgi:hypothetical protein
MRNEKLRNGVNDASLQRQGAPEGVLDLDDDR